MELIKNIYNKNKYIVISAVLLVLCSEFLVSVMNALLYKASWSVIGNVVLKLLVMIVCIFVAYKSAEYLGKCCLSFNFLIYTLLAILGCPSGPFNLLTAGYGFYSFFALLFMSVYYVEKSIKSVKCSLIYFVLVTAYVVGNYNELAAFIALSLHLLLLMSTYNKIDNKVIKNMHFIFGAICLLALIFLAAYDFVVYAEVKFLEGSSTIRLLESLQETLRAFGSSDVFFELPKAPVDYNPARIFGFYGYVTGGLLLVIIAVFALSVAVKVIESTSEIKPLMLVAVAVLSVRCLASVLLNCGVLCGIDVKMPFVCDSVTDYLFTGILLGIIFSGSKEGDDNNDSDDYYENDEEDNEQWKAKIISLKDFIVNTN